MRNLRLLGVSVLMSGLTACQLMGGLGSLGGGGNCFDEKWLRQNIAIGRTTAQQVVQMCGRPKDKTEGPSRPSVYVYRSETNDLLEQVLPSGVPSGLSDARSKSVMFWFHNGKVSDYRSR